MVTVGELLSQFEREAYAVCQNPARESFERHTANWMMLSRPILQALANLRLGGAGDRLNGGLVDVLETLATGPLHPLPEHVTPTSGMVQATRTLGLLADVLADMHRVGPGTGLGTSEALKLQASIIAPVHMLAGSTRVALTGQLSPPKNRLIPAIRDLVRVSEPYALIPPSQRSSILELGRIRTDQVEGLDGAVTKWADLAQQVLEERSRVTGWAMQAIAGGAALICHASYDEVERQRVTGLLPDRDALNASAALSSAVTAWRAAAAWPPHLRLGGNTRELRGAVNDLREECTRFRHDLNTFEHALLVSQPIARLHAQTMERLVTGHELWVHGPALGAPGGLLEGWVREPQWSHQGLFLMRASQAGVKALDRSVENVEQLRRAAVFGRESSWPPEQLEPVGRRREDRDHTSLGAAAHSRVVHR